MNPYNPEQQRATPRFKIEGSEIDEIDRIYLNYLQAARDPISIKLWAEFCKMEEEFIISLVDKYKIPIIKGNPDKVQPLDILNTSEKASNADIAVNLMAKWKQMKAIKSQPKSDE